MEKIVNAVIHFKQEEKKLIRVHYTDGTTKVFDPVEWGMLIKEGKKLWDEHEKEIMDLRNERERFDG